MIKVVCWNIAKKKDPWHCIAKMAEQGEADVALLQEAGHVPGNLIEKLEVDDKLFWHPMGFDRLPVIVKLSNRVTVERYRQVPVLQILPEDAIGVSDIGTIAAAKVTPEGKPDEAFIVVSMYARWLRVHPSTCSKWIVSAHSAHRIISDLAAFIGNTDTAKHRILAAGDLNMFYGSIGEGEEWERAVWGRMQDIGLEFLGPQLPCGGNPPAPGVKMVDVPDDSKNVPTFHTVKEGTQEAKRQLDYVFASMGFHKQVKARAMNGIDEWGPSDHCRLLITVS